GQVAMLGRDRQGRRSVLALEIRLGAIGDEDLGDIGTTIAGNAHQDAPTAAYIIRVGAAVEETTHVFQLASHRRSPQVLVVAVQTAAEKTSDEEGEKSGP